MITLNLVTSLIHFLGFVPLFILAFPCFFFSLINPLALSTQLNCKQVLELAKVCEKQRELCINISPSFSASTQCHVLYEKKLQGC